jgi:large repetitive protein
MYEYSDADGDQEGATAIAWYVGSGPDGSDRTIISGENTRFLTVTHAFQGKYVFFEITPSAVTGTTHGVPVLSDPAEIAANAAPIASEVAIAGQPGHGNALYGNYLFEDSDGESEGSSSFQWYIGMQADGTGKTPIAGATSRELWITSYEQGKYVFFEVTPRSLTGAAEGISVASSPVAIPANAAPYVHSIFLSGMPKTGETLAVNFTYEDAENDSPEATPTIQWYMAADSDLMTSEAISGETDTFIVVTSDMENKWVYAVVTPRASTGTVEGEPARSNALKIPVNQAPSAYNVSLAGTPYVGEQLNASYTYSDSEYDSEGPPSYQWYAADDASGTNKAPIAGATSNFYTITPQEAGKFVAVAVTPTALTGTSAGEPAESSWTEIAPE